MIKSLANPTTRSWITYYFETTFNIEKGKLGSIFFTASIIAAASMLVASSLAKRFGNVKTMVFTHIPSSIFLALLPVPRDLPLALVLLMLRSSTASMDTAPRAAFLATIILPGERTAVMGIINVVKTAAQSGIGCTCGYCPSNGCPYCPCIDRLLLL